MNFLVGTLATKIAATSPSYTYSYSTSSDIATTTDSMAAVLGVLSAMAIPIIIIGILMIVAQWKIFTKAGEAGWKSIIPIYNLVTLFQIIGLSPLLILILLVSWIPIVGPLACFVLTIIENIKLAQAFGKSTGFAVGLILLGPIFTLMLAFGSAEYVGPQTQEAK